MHPILHITTLLKAFLILGSERTIGGNIDGPGAFGGSAGGLNGGGAPLGGRGVGPPLGGEPPLGGGPLGGSVGRGVEPGVGAVLGGTSPCFHTVVINYAS